MAAVTATEDVYQRLAGFVQTHLLDGDAGDLDATTPLLELGILTSMNTVRLIGFIRDELGVTVPPIYMSGKHFKDLRAITSLVVELSSPAERV